MRVPCNGPALAGVAATPTLQIYHPALLSISSIPLTPAHRKRQDASSLLKGPNIDLPHHTKALPYKFGM